METSIFLARVIGLVGVMSSTAILIRYRESINLEAEAVKSKLSIYVSGFVFLIIGVLLIVSHSIWVFDWRIVITLLGWIILLKGLGRIFFPSSIKSLIEKKLNNRWFIIGEIAVLLIGFYLLYYGFIVYR